MSGPREETTARRRAELGVAPEKLPRHVAIVMDGNGRWARARGLPRIAGHERGAEVVRSIVTACAELRLECLTLYSFSVENWTRPREEVEALMDLLAFHLVQERATMMDNDVRLRVIGRRSPLPARVLESMDETVRLTASNRGMALCLAINYGGRAEIVEALHALCTDVTEGRLDPQSIDERSVSERLWTGGLPDPDLVIRTSGEMRISNFLLWQIAYAEMVVTDVLWPDFGVEDLYAALRTYAQRDRRFGGVSA